MDWGGQLIMAQRRVTDVETKLARPGQSTRLVGVLRQSLALAKAHVGYIERRIAAHEGVAKTSAARTALFDSSMSK
jgi:hypothetical protein